MPLGPQEGDRLVERLTALRDGLDRDEGEAFLARLVLLLANELDDLERTLAAIDAAAAAAAAGR